MRKIVCQFMLRFVSVSFADEIRGLSCERNIAA
jgi:hypothetical protein